MKEKLLNRILMTGFILNITLFLFFIGLIALIFIDSELFEKIFFNKTNNFIISIVYSIFSVPVLFLWIYNIRFLFKYDRYSKSLIPLIFFGGIYSPIYFYRVKIKGRPLRNKIEKPPEQEIDRTIQFEEYENESDYQDDLKDLNEKYGG